VTLLCGRYEGVDERLLARRVDEELSLALVPRAASSPAMALIDAVVRQLAGALGDEHRRSKSRLRTAFSDWPAVHAARGVPGCGECPRNCSRGTTGNRRWRLKQALGRTWLRRPDLLAARPRAKRNEAAGGVPERVQELTWI